MRSKKEVTTVGISYQDNPSVIGKASTAGITLVALVVTIILHYYYGMKYSNSNGFLKAII